MHLVDINKLEERKLFLGIDPSFSNFGACIYNPETGEMKLNTSTFNEGLEWIGKNCRLENVIAYVENPNLDSPIFKMWGLVQAEIKAMQDYNRWLTSGQRPPIRKKVTINDVRSKFSIAMKYASSVGENRANAKQIIKMLAQRGVPVIEIAPSKRQRADKAQKKAGKAKIDMKFMKMPTKTNARQFEELTGYTGRSNEHNRDAATLIWGRSLRQSRMTITGIYEKEIKKPASFPKQTNENLFLISKEEQVGILDESDIVNYK